MKQTNLKMVKEICKLLFNAVPIKSVEGFSFLIQHPFASNNLVSVPDNLNLEAYKGAIQKELVTGKSCNGVVDYSKSRIEYLESLQKYSLEHNIIDITIPEGAEVYKQHIFNLIDKSKTLDDILMLLNKPWYMTFLKYSKEYLSSRDLGSLLGECWVMQEYPSRDSNASLKEIINWFKESDKSALMDEEDYIKYTNIKSGCLGFNLEVYRGVSFDGKPKGLSWTLSKDKALWFASRFKGKNAKVYKMTIDLNNEKEADAILAYFSSRNEDEVVIDTSVCNNWEVVVE